MLYAMLEIDPLVSADDRRVKIGFSSASSVRERVSRLQVGNSRQLSLLAVREGERVDEVPLQSRFRSLHIAGEWFWFRDELAAEVATWTQVDTDWQPKRGRRTFGTRPPGKTVPIGERKVRCGLCRSPEHTSRRCSQFANIVAIRARARLREEQEVHDLRLQKSLKDARLEMARRSEERKAKAAQRKIESEKRRANMSLGLYDLCAARALSR